MPGIEAFYLILKLGNQNLMIPEPYATRRVCVDAGEQYLRDMDRGSPFEFGVFRYSCVPWSSRLVAPPSDDQET